MITIDDYFMGRDTKYADQCTPEIKANAAKVVETVNKLLERMQIAGHVNSGWRPAAVNDATSNASKGSKHLKALACDLGDADYKIRSFLRANPGVMEELCIWCEHYDYTPTWCHVQIVPPASGNRWYQPYPGPPKAG